MLQIKMVKYTLEIQNKSKTKTLHPIVKSDTNLAQIKKVNNKPKCNRKNVT